MTHNEIEDYMLSKPGAVKSFPFDEFAATFKVGSEDESKIFAIMPTNKDPVNINLKCDPALAEHLRQKYESVMPGYHMNKRHWNTLVLSGQLSDQEVFDLVDHSYQLVVESLSKQVQANLEAK